MAIQWSPISGHMRVGIDFRYGAYDANSTQVTMYVDYYIRVESWRYADNQSLNIAVQDRWLEGISFYNYQASAGTYEWLHATRSFTMPLYYGGGPSLWAQSSIGGAYDGSAPLVQAWTTVPARPPAVPDPPGLGVSSVTSSSAYMGLTAPSNNGSSIVEYSIQVATDTGFTNVVATRSSSGTVTGLNAATTYYARARARNGVGWGGYSGTQGFTTGASAPAQVGTVTVSNVGQISADLSWPTPGNGGSAITGYEIQIATNSGFTAGVQNLSDSASPYTASLLPGTAYWARVRAVNGVGPGAYSAAVSLTTLAGTPVIIAPTEAQAKTNGIPDVTVESLGITGSADFEVQFSQDNTFATGVTTVNKNVTGPTGNSQYLIQNPAVLLLNGTWYVRARVTNNVSSYTTPWSATRTFTQSHSPSRVQVSPIANAVVAYAATTQFRWNFVDSAAPYDIQNSYQLVIENNATGAAVYDSGKAPLLTTPANAVAEVDIALAAGLKNQTLRWRVKVWDDIDQASEWSGWSLFKVADAPVVTILTPTAGVNVSSGAPTFSWTTAVQSGGTQASAAIEVFDSLTNALIWSATVVGAGTSVTPGTVVFTNETDYYFNLTVTDTNGLVTVESETFHTSYVAPATVDYTIFATNVDDLGYVDVDWLAASPDAAFVSWRVYRRTSNEDAWTLQTEIFDQNVRNYRDFMVTGGTTYFYSVTQTAMRSGVKLEGPVGYRMSGGNPVVEARSFPITLSYYWLVHPTDVNLSVRLLNVVTDDVTLEFEKEVYHLIGRGRHVDYGDELGYTGSITCQVRTADTQSAFRTTMENLRRSSTEYHLRTPFGRLFKVSIGDIQWSPMAGTGLMENGDLSFTYEEVA